MNRLEIEKKLKQELSDCDNTIDVVGEILELNGQRIDFARHALQANRKGNKIGVELSMNKLAIITQKIDKLKSNF